TKTGWTVGGGLEYRLAGNWTAKAEYLYMDLGSLSHSFVYTANNPFIGFPTTNVYSSSIRDHIVRVGLNYQLWDAAGPVPAGPAPAPVSKARPIYKAAPIVEAPYTWSGFYIGANVGHSVGRDASSLTSVFGPNTSGIPPTGVPLQHEDFYLQPQGLIGGGQIGV